MAPKRYPKAAPKRSVAAPVTIGRLKARIEILKKDRDQWKHKAVGMETFMEKLAKEVEKNKEVNKVFISVRRSSQTKTTKTTQTKTTKLGRLPRLTKLPPKIVVDDKPPDSSGAEDSSSAEGVGSEPTSAAS